MKNVKKLVFAALMVAVMAFALCACGSSNVDGTYVVSESNGASVDTALEGLATQGIELTAEQLCTIKLEGGKNLTFTLLGESKTGTYEVSGETLKLTIDGSTQEATIKDGVITINAGGQSMSLKKK